jgi:hypothetical protein
MAACNVAPLNPLGYRTTLRCSYQMCQVQWRWQRELACPSGVITSRALRDVDDARALRADGRRGTSVVRSCAVRDG